MWWQEKITRTQHSAHKLWGMSTSCKMCLPLVTIHLHILPYFWVWFYVTVISAIVTLIYLFLCHGLRQFKSRIIVLLFSMSCSCLLLPVFHSHHLHMFWEVQTHKRETVILSNEKCVVIMLPQIRSQNPWD